MFVEAPPRERSTQRLIRYIMSTIMAIRLMLTPGPWRNREAITLTSSPRGPVTAVSLSSFWSNFLLDRVKSGADFCGAPDVVPANAGIGDEVVDAFFVERVIAHVAAGRAVGRSEEHTSELQSRLH